MVFVFTVSYGQTQIETGFNKNFDSLFEKMLAHSIVAQKRVYDNLNNSGSLPHDFKSEFDLRISCINAHSKCKEFNSKKKTADKSALLTNIEVVKKTKKLELCVRLLLC